MQLLLMRAAEVFGVGLLFCKEQEVPSMCTHLHTARFGTCGCVLSSSGLLSFQPDIGAMVEANVA